MDNIDSHPAPTSDSSAENPASFEPSKGVEAAAAFEDAGHVHGPQCNHGKHVHHSITPFIYAQPKPGRNEPCLCGSGKKSKKCCA